MRFSYKILFRKKEGSVIMKMILGSKGHVFRACTKKHDFGTLKIFESVKHEEIRKHHVLTLIS